VEQHFELINKVSFYVVSLVWMYYMFCYIIAFFRYTTLYQRIYYDAPISFLMFCACTWGILEVLICGYGTDEINLVSALTGLSLAAMISTVPIFLLFKLLHMIDVWRDKIPEK
jgi:hypothetical protein